MNKQINKIRQDEASNIRLETYEYMNYMEKKTSKRQSMIVSLNDQNQKEIEKIKVRSQFQQVLKYKRNDRNRTKAEIPRN